MNWVTNSSWTWNLREQTDFGFFLRNIYIVIFSFFLIKKRMMEEFEFFNWLVSEKREIWRRTRQKEKKRKENGSL
jgi:hypothetical protein